MKKLYFLLTLLMTQLTFGMETTYIWENEKNKLETGKCYEVDSETNGKKFSVLVKSEYCKPQETQLLFDYESGKCFEVDKNSGGKKYISKVSLETCATMETVFSQQKVANKKTDCFLVDKKTMGLKFYKRSKMKNCINKEDYYWKSISETSGECWYKSATTGQKSKVAPKYCRPETVVNKFKRTSPLSGKCYAIHPNGYQYFIKSQKLELCQPDKTIFVFYIPQNRKTGQCYEIDEETKGEHYIKKVSPTYCK